MSLNESWSIIFIAMTMTVAIFAAIISLSRRNVRRDQCYFLAGFFGLYALIKLDELYLFTQGYEVWPHLAGIVFGLKLLLPPMVYFYARSMTSVNPTGFKLSDLKALIAPLLACVVAMPYYALSAEQKIALMNPATRDPELYQNAVLGCQIGLLLFILVSLVYLRLSFKLLITHSIKLQHIFSRIDDKSIDWLRWVLVLMAFGWTGYGVSELWYIQGSRPEYIAIIILFLELIWIGLIAFRGINQMALKLSANDNTPVSAVDFLQDKANQYARSGLTEERRFEIAHSLKRVMGQEHLFKNPELCLRDLSTRLNISENSLSETLSQHLATNFFDYVNRFRVARACELLTESDMKILAVALEAGFNSRSTFNCAFKKHTGYTPSQYRKNLTSELLL